MIYGVGVDIVEIKKIKSAVRKWGNGFLNKVFTAGEMEYCNSRRFPYMHLASRFAAKEAIVKAFGMGFWRNGVNWTDFEIVKLKDGGAVVKLAKNIKKQFKKKEVLVSMSHCSSYAVAQAVIYKKN